MMLRNPISTILLLTPLVLDAHHSTARNFSQEVVTLEGTITDILWENPHASFVLVVTNDDGIRAEWSVELIAQAALERRGFDFDALQAGMVITLTGRVGYEAGNLLFSEALLADGRVVTEQDTDRDAGQVMSR